MARVALDLENKDDLHVLRACFEILEMSTLLCFRGPSGSDAISKIP